MIKAEAFAAIRGSLLLQGVNDAEIARLAELCEERQMAEGTTVFIENMPGESLFVIRTGSVRVSRMFAEGDEKNLVVLGPGEIFGEMAIVDGMPRSATARVAQEVALISLRKKDFESLCQSDPVLALKLVLNIVRGFNQRMREANDEYRDMLTWSLQGNS
jgi:CRP-like cAMP-binding protein